MNKDETIRLWRNRAMALQRELIEVQGACVSDECVRHFGHKGPCPMKAEMFND